jgi:two-component system, OmpR family, response regulator
MINETDLRAAVNGRTPVILCIDDEPGTLKLRRMLLETAGCSVLVARSPSEGVQLFRSNQIDLVLLDYWMADMNGLAVAAELKQANSKVPIVMFSGFHPILDEFVGPVDEWLIKDEIEPDELLVKVSRLLSRNGQCDT